MPSAELYGEDLGPATLHLYLKDSTFVEYFNSFLLLPAFSSRVFYNVDSGFFEQVHGEGVTGWVEDGVTPSTSVATLYLTDEAVGPSLDTQQTWSWVVQHRLPLFLRSDLYSEYKLCTLLTHPTTKATSSGECLPKQTKTLGKSPSNTKSKTERMQQDVTLPLLPVSPPGISRENSLTALPQQTNSTAKITSSKSNIELSSSSKTKPSGHRTRHKRSSSFDLCSTISVLLEEEQNPPCKLEPEDYRYLGTKSGMSALWRFLRGKAGERNWLFWLDAERAKYFSKPIEQQRPYWENVVPLLRLLRELRERYLHVGSPLELPADSRQRLGVNRMSQLTLELLQELQWSLVLGLREYWCPRFILHHRHHHRDPSPSRRPLSRSYSTAPMTLEDNSTYPHLPHPLTPSQTPTFRRITYGRPRSKSSPTRNRWVHEEQSNPKGDLSRHSATVAPSVPDLMVQSGSVMDYLSSREYPSHNDLLETLRPQTAPEECTSTLPAHSRKIWTSDGRRREEVTDKDQRSRNIPRGNKRGRSSAAHYNKLAKYAPHHLPDVNSRCASAMGSQECPGMCDSRCQVLSVSGTPLLPSYAPTPTGDAYTPLLYCLTTEQRKAGGYFQEYLENLDNKVSLHCLLFWREVQEYKLLFTGRSFSPCAVEMKAKALYGRYATESSGESIQCPPVIFGQITTHLWPAYEDLFDAAEEHVLGLLLEQWLELRSNDERIFQKLDVAQVLKAWSGPPSQRGGMAELEDLDEEYDESYSALQSTPRPSSPTKLPTQHPSSRVNITTKLPSSIFASPTLTRSPTPTGILTPAQPTSSAAFSLSNIIDVPSELEHFKIFLNENYSAQDLMCWMEIESFRGIPAGNKYLRDLQARQLRTKYFNKEYFFGSNSPCSKEALRQIVAAGGGNHLPARPRTPVFREAQKHVRSRLERKWVAAFITTPEFLARYGATCTTVNGKKSCKTDAKALVYEKSFANSREALLLRKTLQDEERRRRFLRFLTISSKSGTQYPQQDIEFWLEVQRFKEMCHAHTTDQILQAKASAIIECYFQSSVPPKLQLDIPTLMADQVVRKNRNLGPYSFREAQASVFKQLYYHWQDYQNFTSDSNNDTQTNEALDKLEAKLKHLHLAAKERELQEKLEEERRKINMPRFETLQEKEERLQQEKEFASFGKVSVAFRLSTPNPDSYTYYTELPEECYDKEDGKMEDYSKIQNGRKSCWEDTTKGGQRQPKNRHQASTEDVLNSPSDVSPTARKLQGRKPKPASAEIQVSRLEKITSNSTTSRRTVSHPTKQPSSQFKFVPHSMRRSGSRKQSNESTLSVIANSGV